MTNTELKNQFAAKLIQRVAFRMETFGDTYTKAKAMVSLESCAGAACWAIVDAHFEQVAA